MKISKTFLFFMAVVVVIAGSVWLYMQYGTAVKERTEAQEALESAGKVRDQLTAEKPGLNSQLADASAAIQTWQAKISVAQDKLAQAESGLVQAESQLPTEVNNLDYDEVLLAMAHASGLEVVSLETSGQENAQVGDNTNFVATSFSLNVRGPVSNILDFYNLITSDPAFRTGQIDSVNCGMPQPLTAAEKTDLSKTYYDQLLSELQDSLTVEERVVLIEEATMQLLNEKFDHVTLDQMTTRIREAMTANFGADVADRLAKDIALALEQQVADSLIQTIAGIYGEAVGKLFTEGKPQLTPVLLEVLGPEISDELRVVPVTSIPGIVSGVIANRLETAIQARIEGMVDRSEIERKLAKVELESGQATASISIIMSAYVGG